MCVTVRASASPNLLSCKLEKGPPSFLNQGLRQTEHEPESLPASLLEQHPCAVLDLNNCMGQPRHSFSTGQPLRRPHGKRENASPTRLSQGEGREKTLKNHCLYCYSTFTPVLALNPHKSDVWHRGRHGSNTTILSSEKAEAPTSETTCPHSKIDTSSSQMSCCPGDTPSSTFSVLSVCLSAYNLSFLHPSLPPSVPLSPSFLYSRIPMCFFSFSRKQFL